MHFVFLRLDRLKVGFFVAFAISIIALRLTLTHISMQSDCSQLSKSKLIHKCIAMEKTENHFNFPEVNETEVLLSPGTDFTEVKRQDLSQNILLDSSLELFKPALSYEERQFMLVLFQYFVRACSKFNVTYFLYGGTLLGAFRHHDLIPWDDDLDVVVNSSQKALLKLALLSMGKQFGVYSPDGDRWWKFYWQKTKTLPYTPFRWPYIDIFFFLENDTHIFDEVYSLRSVYTFPKDQVFPLSYHPFAGAMLPVPCNISAIVENNFSPSECSSRGYNHKLEKGISDVITIPCTKIKHVYPFVSRKVTADSVYEYLLKDGVLIKVVTLPKTCG